MAVRKIYRLTKYIAASIVRPIDDLVEVLDRMMQGDLMLDIKPRVKHCSKEIKELYQVFSKLKIVLRFGDDSFVNGNDAEALMNYSQALKLFEEFQNVTGIGICWNNIGNIHLKNGRYEEAVKCYILALEIAEDMNRSKALYFLCSNNSVISIETRRAYSDVEETSEDLVTVRKQQLATALLRMSEHTEKKQWTEAINLLTQVLKSIDENQYDQEKSVNTLLEITQAYIKSHQFEKAEESISQVYSRINNLASRYCSVPVEILRERMCYCEGLLAKELCEYRRAAELLTTCLEMNSIYDPVIRCSALKQLRQIFETRGVDCWEVDQHIEDYEAVNKDIVFLMDYSESMMHQNRIQKALSNIINVFDKFVEKDDRVAFIPFNKECHIAFNLTAKGQNTAFLRQHILKWNKPSGQTAFYDAVSTALNEFSAYKDDSAYECDLLVINGDEEEAVNRVPKRAKWILALTDGEDTCSSISYRKLKAKLESSKANLVTIGLALTPSFKPLIESLCQTTRRGVFIESENCEELDGAFQKLSALIAPLEITIESLIVE